MPYPGVKTLMTHLGVERDKAQRIRGLMDGSAKTRTYASVVAWESQLYNPSKRLDRALLAINEELDTFGVEPIRAADHYDSYWGDTVALYCNTGDSYGATILYDVQRDSWYVTSYGDWIDQYERSRRKPAIA